MKSLRPTDIWGDVIMANGDHVRFVGQFLIFSPSDERKKQGGNHKGNAAEIYLFIYPLYYSKADVA